MNTLEHRLLNDFQRGLPLCPAPFAAIGEALGIDQARVIDTLDRLKTAGKISRVGAVFRPNSVNASTLAAMRVPAQRVEEVAEMVSACPGVSHNYLRAYDWNLWFVASACDQPALRNLLDTLQIRSGCPMLRLPLVESYHIDLGFDLDGVNSGTGSPPKRITVTRHCTPPPPLSKREAILADQLAQGLALRPLPYAELADRVHSDESAVIDTISRWIDDGVISRFGVIVRHHELGFSANAMVAFDIADGEAADAGLRIAAAPGVTLSACRARSLPDWPYNIYCMIHGQDERSVLTQIQDMRKQCGLLERPFAVLFSRQRFKQQAARVIVEALNG